MATLNIEVDGEKRGLYMDTKLYNTIEAKIRPQVNKKDNDWVWIVDGMEGSGKSVFALQLAKVLDPTFCLDRVAMTPQQFTKAIIEARKGEAVIFDEGFTGLSSRASLSEVNRLIVSLMMEMRQKNLFVIIVMPTIFLLDRYVALHRARGLFHIYIKEGKRGRWIYFNNKKKKLLYLLGRKLYSYAQPKSKLWGRFYDQYTINEEAYREKKKLAFQQKLRRKKESTENYKEHRDKLLKVLKKLGHNNSEISRLLSQEGVKLARSTISEIVKENETTNNNVGTKEN